MQIKNRFLYSSLGSFDYDKLINYLLVAYAFALPISKAGVNIFATLILITWLIQGNWKEKYQLYKTNTFFIAFSAFIALSILSIPFASSTTFALDYIAKYKHFLIIFPIYSSLNPKYVKHILSSFLLAMFLSELVSYGIFLELWTYKNVSPHNPTPFMDHVSYSVYLAFTSILLLTRLLDNQLTNTPLKLIYLLFFTSSTVNLFVNGGRTGQVTFVILIFVTFFMSLKSKLKAIAISLAFTLIIFPLAYKTSPNFQNKMDQLSVGIEKILHQDNYKYDGFSQRVSLWLVGLDNLKDNYLFGKGIGNDTVDMAVYAKQRGFDPDFVCKFGDNHNMFLTVWLQLGLLGFLIFVAIFYSIFTLSFTSKRYQILNLTFIAGFFLWSLGNTTFHTMNPMTFFALFAGLFNTLAYQRGQKKSGIIRPENDPHSIKYYVKRFFYRERQRFQSKTIIDFPAGNGVSSKILRHIGANVLPYDLFPEYFQTKNLQCNRANINKGIPLNKEVADALLCQEGLEHFENQLQALKEFNRVLKPHGSLIITTPNASNMVGRVSYLLSENELFHKMMPQNELDDIWISKQELTSEVYYGHIFLIGINKLRLLAKLAGFKIKHIENTRIKTTAVILLILFYPFILFSNWRSYRRAIKKNRQFSNSTKEEIYGEVFKLSISPRLLVNSHIFIEFEKVYTPEEVKQNLSSREKEFKET